MVKTIAPHLFDPTTPVIDIRKHPHNEQIRGAVRYDGKKLLEADKLVLPIAKGGTVVLSADDNELAEAVGQKLEREGYGQVLLLEGGLAEWKAHHLPIEAATQEQPIPGEEDAGLPLI